MMSAYIFHAKKPRTKQPYFFVMEYVGSRFVSVKCPRFAAGFYTQTVYIPKVCVGFLLLLCSLGGADCGKSKKHLILFLPPCVCGFPPTPPHTHTRGKNHSAQAPRGYHVAGCRHFMPSSNHMMLAALLITIDLQWIKQKVSGHKKNIMLNRKLLCNIVR